MEDWPLRTGYTRDGVGDGDFGQVIIVPPMEEDIHGVAGMAQDSANSYQWDILIFLLLLPLILWGTLLLLLYWGNVVHPGQRAPSGGL